MFACAEGVKRGVLAGEESAEAADLVIASAEDKAKAKTDEKGRVLRLRRTPEGSDDSIYRYDRAGLIMALKAAAGGE